ncbi:hypothetical protein CRUP_017144 [Coryphaenoides rupestris]|nr:hypothetical protein CRUP_017144 [Coryphaenoides rupestris]
MSRTRGGQELLTYHEKHIVTPDEDPDQSQYFNIEDREEEPNLFFTMAELKACNVAPCPLADYVTDEALAALTKAETSESLHPEDHNGLTSFKKSAGAIILSLQPAAARALSPAPISGSSHWKRREQRRVRCTAGRCRRTSVNLATQALHGLDDTYHSPSVTSAPPAASPPPPPPSSASAGCLGTFSSFFGAFSLVLSLFFSPGVLFSAFLSFFLAPCDRVLFLSAMLLLLLGALRRCGLPGFCDDTVGPGWARGDGVGRAGDGVGARGTAVGDGVGRAGGTRWGTGVGARGTGWGTGGRAGDVWGARGPGWARGTGWARGGRGGRAGGRGGRAGTRWGRGGRAGDGVGARGPGGRAGDGVGARGTRWGRGGRVGDVVGARGTRWGTGVGSGGTGWARGGRGGRARDVVACGGRGGRAGDAVGDGVACGDALGARGRGGRAGDAVGDGVGARGTRGARWGRGGRVGDVVGVLPGRWLAIMAEIRLCLGGTPPPSSRTRCLAAVKMPDTTELAAGTPASSCSRLLACAVGLCLMKENSLQGRASEETAGDEAGEEPGAWGGRSSVAAAGVGAAVSGGEEAGECLPSSSSRTCRCQSGLLLQVSLNWGSSVVTLM